MFLRALGVNWVLFWATAMLWLRGPAGVEVGEIVVSEASVARSVSSGVVEAVDVAVLRVDGPAMEGACRSASGLR